MKITKVALESFDEAMAECNHDCSVFAEEHENEGICFICGHFQSFVEPDAENYDCEECGREAVQGMIIMLLTLTMMY